MTRIEKEKGIVELMIRLYCRKRHSPEKEMCAKCETLRTYAFERLEHCPDGEGKPSCRRCHRHCYKPEMRSAIREVMRWAGPRMFLYHPLEAFKHISWPFR